MHLTNYAINKNSSDYESGDEEEQTGHKRMLHQIFDHIKETYGDDTVWEKIKDIICKTLITVAPSLGHAY